MNDRREYPRHRRELKLLYHSKEISNRGITHDICQGGVFVITSQVLPAKSKIELEFLGGDGQILMHLQGKIAWVNMGQVMALPPGFGVTLRNMSEEELSVLLNAGDDDTLEGKCA